MDKNLRLKLMTSAILVAMAQMSTAYAEDAAPAADAPVAVEAAAADSAPLNLDKIVVTGSAKKISKMKSSVSISTMNAEQVQASGATNAAEVLRTIPGVRSESSGGEGNANMTVRGLPISAGGARYLQMQEDGLPILQFGDIAFATPDMFMRVDQGLGSLEVIRGGSASTAATNSPGGIINFINQTGEVKGGKVGVSAGLNFNEWRTDFSYGGPIDDNGLRAFVSGFYRAGDGFRDSGERMEQGGQIKANITKEFDGGFIRASIKHLDDQTPINMPVPITTSNGHISEIPGINPRTVSFYSNNWPKDVTLTGNNGSKASDVNDGMTVKTDSIGAELSYDFAEGWNVSDKFRYANNRGRFIGIFPSSGVTAGAFNAVVFNTSNNMDLIANDLKIAKTFDSAAAGKWTPSVGLYTSKQDVDLTWSFNQYNISAENSPGTITFLNSSITQWGNCCTRDIKAEYRTTSPYASLAWEFDKFNADISVRRDNQDASGNYSTASATGGLGSFVTRNKINYNIDETSYSGGANYRINPNIAVFGRVSEGYAFNADRIMFGSANLNGGTIPVNNVKQYEAGVKWREGNLSTFVTLFKAKTDESNFDATTQVSTANKYDTKGVEVEAGYSIGNFKIGGGLTYTDAEVTNSPGNLGLEGKEPNRQAKWVYQITPSYVWDKLTIGGNIVGTSSSIDSRDGATGKGVKMPGFAVVNSFLKYQYDKDLQLSLSANNLFDTIGYTEAQGSVARSVDGRSVKAAVVYSF
jgi:outer membrane receptor protein involved in Fe transport